MFTSFSTALSALNAHSTAIDVIGNNLANMNTPGFKANVVSFYDLVTQSVGAGLGETQVGFGVGKPITLRVFSQGAIQTSAGDLDAAIQGDGFLVVKDKSTNGIVYTRGGNLEVDKDGTLMTANGQRVQGWTGIGGAVSTNGPTGDIVIPVGQLKAPATTTSFSFDVNLNAAGVAGTSTGAFSSSIEMYDSLGESHVVQVAYTKGTAPNTWNYTATFPDSDVTTPIAPVTGTLTFDTAGHLTDPAPTAAMPKIDIKGLKTGAADMSVTWQLYNGLTPRFTQFSQPSATSANAQDGAPAAQLLHVGIANGGVVLAQFSDGKQTVVGQLAMASVRNPESLISVGENAYSLSARSALPAVGVPGTGGRGTILGGAVESSNVDIAREFTNLIVLQRGYQANAKVITTVDDLSQETINLKR